MDTFCLTAEDFIEHIQRGKCLNGAPHAWERFDHVKGRARGFGCDICQETCLIRIADFRFKYDPCSRLLAHLGQWNSGTELRQIRDFTLPGTISPTAWERVLKDWI